MLGVIQESVKETRSTLPELSGKVISGLIKGRSQHFDRRTLNVRPDVWDGRDKYYEPELVEIKPTLAPLSIFIPTPDESRKTTFFRSKIIRNQHEEGSCTGQALAACIDIQNFTRSNIPRDQSFETLLKNEDDHLLAWFNSIVSSRMLYEMARSLDDDPEDRIPGSTIRNALKAFQHNGVCSASLAPYISGEPGWHLNLNQAKNARKNSLGAYFRIRPELYDYHAALNDTGAIYVSAMIHNGWMLDKALINEPFILNDTCYLQIPYHRDNDLQGAHAFVIVGYTETGFLVLNSWGHQWGVTNNYNAQPHFPKGVPGIALWKYSDWQDNVLDAWVFRLAVPSEHAFQLNCRRNRNVSPIPGKPDSRIYRIEINGHYIHLKDGKFVRTGSYPNSKHTHAETNDLLTKRLRGKETSSKQYDRVLIVFPSGLTPIEENASLGLSLISKLKNEGTYPFILFWNYSKQLYLHHLLRASAESIPQMSSMSQALLQRKLEKEVREYAFFSGLK